MLHKHVNTSLMALSLLCLDPVFFPELWAPSEYNRDTICQTNIWIPNLIPYTPSPSRLLSPAVRYSEAPLISHGITDSHSTEMASLLIGY